MTTPLNPALPRRRLAGNLPHWTVILSLAILAAALAMAILAPQLANFEPTRINAAMRLQPASETYWLGTDSFGRDLYSRIIHGARVSLVVGAGVAAGAILIGLPLGLLAGWFRGLDAVLMRLMDGMMAIPGILLAIAIVALTKAGLVTVIIAIMIPEIPQVVRLVRSRVLAARAEPYVEAAQLLGTPAPRLILRHLLPATIAPLIVQATYIYASAILTEAALSFLGVGIGTEIPTWGNIMAEGRLYFAMRPWLVFWPAIVLSLCILSINLLGDALRDRLDPKMKGRAD
ncbi:ABC transporter permease [Paracoccus denitrificans]|jgi:peptide/nickel transport system permease protein|uniref:Binding-protein-dependent transport systems inner membrane component n=1 Tax=Paracoccus denitrificans (strain Pd 1222) TaxID=318586 RepID=A1B8M4_PARDP|nr:ABC transporter permease [Paracoccus denitrificans]ABL71868.1 binding-protein-dependent transport systems inner membrane component [Paracoccus denitrificans PD1222]MBB4628019.1 peptide/nickel transport system permease protein [Paracoccus denitrificans]MCU7429088.1 ABC transporter permease [Paracoccus denitrificans]QAR28458.1 ABC transporter permease [Paracoccus denitrificans]UFS67786.1 ABC transporter permease [Paracoccus denitrificans]